MSDNLFLASYTVVDYGDKVKFLIPSNKIGILIIFSIFWLLFWTLLGIDSINSFRSGDFHERNVFNTIPGFIFWVVCELLTIYTLLWQFFGKEITVISNESIKVSRRILGIGFTNEYAADKIADLHVDNIKENPIFLKLENMDNLEKGCKAVVFYYGRRTIKIVSSIVEAEAWQILSTIEQRFPQYRTEEINKVMSDR